MERPTRGMALGGAGAGAVGAVCQTVADRLAASRDLRPSVWLDRGGRLRCVATTGGWPGCEGISPTAGVIGATFTSGVETVVPDAAAHRATAAPAASAAQRTAGPAANAGHGSASPTAAGPAAPAAQRTARPAAVAAQATASPSAAGPAASAAQGTAGPAANATQGTASPTAAAQACLPIRVAGLVVGVLDVELGRPLRAGDIERLRDAADELGRAIAAGGGLPAESAAQRMLRYMTTLSALDEPDAIANALLASAIDVMRLDSAALVRSERVAERGAPATTATLPVGGGDAGAITRRERAVQHGGPAMPDSPRDEPGSPGADARPAAWRRPVAAAGPLAAALAGLPETALEAVERAVHDGAAEVVVAAAGDPSRPELETVWAAGARAVAAVGLVAHAEAQGVLLLAGTTEPSVSIDDVELLELLAAHAATCLRTADLMHSLREQAATDPLTGLGHHATFHATLAHTHRRPSTAVVVLDVDGFKRLNDTFGHQHGDHVLRALARALSGALRRGDTLFRIGGDEFAALLVVSDAAEALEAGRRLHAAVAEAELGVTVSVGVAVPNDGESDAALVGRADRALYRVKAAGRDGVALADDEPVAMVPPL